MAIPQQQRERERLLNAIRLDPESKRKKRI
jgi:hypothetical protein